MNSFIGRTALLAEGRRLLETARLVTWTGPGGVGKTRLLLRLAGEFAASEAYQHGVVVVRLADLREVDVQVEAAIAGALGIPDNAATSGLARIIDFLRHRETLLLLDNCEHLVSGRAGSEGQLGRLVTTLLRACPSLKVMATSRARLGVQGEHLLTVPPLCVGDVETCDGVVGDDDVHEALRLLIDRAAAIGVKICPNDYPAAVRLCQMLDGIALAIELAAVQLDTVALEQMVNHPELLKLLVDGPSEEPHHHTLHAAIEWSYRLLDEPERRLWATCSVFEGGWDLEAAQAMCRDRGIEDADVQALLGRLVRKSVLLADPRPGGTRYRMLETIRQFGRGLVAAAGEQHALADAHADYFDGLAERSAAQWFGKRERAWLYRLEPEVPNIRAALEHYLANPQTAARGLHFVLTACNSRFFVFFGKLNLGRGLLDMALDETRELLSTDRITALCMNAWVASIQGSPELAEPLLAEATSLAEQLGIADSWPPLLNCRATQVWLHDPDPVRARRVCLPLFAAAAQGLEEAGRLGDAWQVRLFLVFSAAMLGDGDRAVAECERVVADADAAGAERCIAWACWSRALVELLHDDPQQALVHAQRGLRIQERCGDLWGPAWTFWIIALILAALGECELGAQVLGGAKRQQLFAQSRISGLLPHLRLEKDAEAKMRDALGDDEFETQVALGDALRQQEQGLHLLFDLAYTPVDQRPTPVRPTRPGGLSAKEFEVVGLVAQGLSNRKIGERLGISFRTVEKHVEKALAKLGLTSRVELTVWHMRRSEPSV